MHLALLSLWWLLHHLVTILAPFVSSIVCVIFPPLYTFSVVLLLHDGLFWYFRSTCAIVPVLCYCQPQHQPFYAYFKGPVTNSQNITPSVRKYLSSKWIKKDVSRCILVLDTSLFVHFDDKYFRTEGVWNRRESSLYKKNQPNIS